MNTKKYYLIIFIIAVLSVSMMGYFRYYKEFFPQRNYRHSSIDRSLSATITPAHSNASILNDQRVFAHPYLPGLTFVYGEDWKIEVIEKFESVFPLIQVKVYKDSISLYMAFNVAHDNLGIRCSNNAKYQAIGNNWYRITDSVTTFYSRKVELNRTLATGSFLSPYGKASDEWSAVVNQNYKICVSGDGRFLIQRTNFNDLLSEEVSVLMQHPKLEGDIKSADLSEIDEIVSSISGIK